MDLNVSSSSNGIALSLQVQKKSATPSSSEAPLPGDSSLPQPASPAAEDTGAAVISLVDDPDDNDEAPTSAGGEKKKKKKPVTEPPKEAPRTRADFAAICRAYPWVMSTPTKKGDIVVDPAEHYILTGSVYCGEDGKQLSAVSNKGNLKSRRRCGTLPTPPLLLLLNVSSP